MSRSKNNKTQKKDGNHRAETKEERMVRLKEQAEAREACFKILPMILGGVLIFMLMFGLYVNNVPPKERKTQQVTPTEEQIRMAQEAMKDGSFMAAMNDAGSTAKTEDEEPPAEAPDLSSLQDDAGSDEHVEL
ncbi:expressed unknown protein [Seminavis robusta]|uniref:Uncharacterized protein n=1 Tax=Seminavis robusta TaxID=568900 RepID=A0A9N8DHJ8_9STRA|nr:expressed unknown protein [Seminavis robusta]|eukprot:Sro93_g048760.1 n/a (133) ;mRNA; r:120886-121375